jgi:hypothetical protein
MPSRLSAERWRVVIRCLDAALALLGRKQRLVEAQELLTGATDVYRKASGAHDVRTAGEALELAECLTARGHARGLSS